MKQICCFFDNLTKQTALRQKVEAKSQLSEICMKNA